MHAEIHLRRSRYVTQGGRAFTLIELMVTISIIALLAGLSLTAIGKAKDSIRRRVCGNNLRQFGIASQLYANDNRRGAYANTVSDSDDNQNWLYPTYIETVKLFSCPATHNRVRESVIDLTAEATTPRLLDLARFAPDKRAFGTSYEIYGFMNYNGPETTELTISGVQTNVPGVQKTEASTSTYVHKNKGMGLQGTSPSPSQIWLFLDADPSFGNFPGVTANHGPAGLNVEFCDGHIEWITQNEWLQSYELSQDEGLSGPPQAGGK